MDNKPNGNGNNGLQAVHASLALAAERLSEAALSLAPTAVPMLGVPPAQAPPLAVPMAQQLSASAAPVALSAPMVSRSIPTLSVPV